jgi:hypothetical protein
MPRVGFVISRRLAALDPRETSYSLGMTIPPSSSCMDLGEDRLVNPVLKFWPLTSLAQ